MTATAINPNALTVGDTVPLVATLLDANDAPINLAGVPTVEFHMTQATAGVGYAAISSTCEIVQAGSGDAITDKGVVRYVWGVGETGMVGVYRLRFVIVYGDATRKSIPNSGGLSFEIVKAG